MTKKEVKKQQIITSTLPLLKQYGYNNTSIQDIIKAADIPKGTFYHYFESKEVFLKEVLYCYFNEEKKNTFYILKDPTIEAITKIKLFYSTQIEQMTTVESRGCLVGNMIQELDHSIEEIGITLHDIYHAIICLINNCLDEADFKAPFGMDNRNFSSFIMNSWQGTLLNFKITKDPKELQNFTTILDHLLA